MKNIFKVLMILIFLSSCVKQKDSSQIDTIEISLQEMPQIDVGSIIENVNIVPLETNENCLIGFVDKIKLSGDNIFILDRKVGKILVYDKAGTFLYKIDKQGQGYGEYISIADFDVEPVTGDIYILDVMTKKMLVFHEDKFIKDINLKFGSEVVSICFLEDNRIAFENYISPAEVESKYHLIITNQNLDILSKEIPYEKGVSLVMGPVSPFSKYNDVVSYTPIYNDTIFHIKNGHTEPSYKLNFGKNWIDEEFLYSKRINPMTFLQELKKSNSIYFLNTIESSSHIFTYFTYKDKKYAYLYDKNTKEGAFIKDYMENECGYYGLPIVPSGDLFAGIVNPHELNNINENKLREIYPNLNIGDFNNNPFISYVKFKKIKSL